MKLFVLTIIFFTFSLKVYCDNEPEYLALMHPKSSYCDFYEMDPRGYTNKYKTQPEENFCDLGLSFTAELLALKAIQSMSYATKLKDVNPTPRLFFQGLDVKRVEQSFGFQAGFRGGIDYYPEDTCLGGYAKYTFFHTREVNVSRGDLNQSKFLQPPFFTILNTSGNLTNIPTAKATSDWTIKYDIFDIVGEFFLLDEAIKFAPMIGIKVGRLDQGGSFAYENINRARLGKFKYTHSFSGGGIVMGLLGELCLKHSLKLSGKLSSSAFFGSYYIEMQGRYHPDPTIFLTLLDGTYVSEFRQLLHITHWGVKMEAIRSICCSHFGFSLGVEGEVWHKYLQNLMFSLNSRSFGLNMDSVMFINTPKNFTLMGFNGGINIYF